MDESQDKSSVGNTIRRMKGRTLLGLAAVALALDSVFGKDESQGNNFGHKPEITHLFDENNPDGFHVENIDGVEVMTQRVPTDSQVRKEFDEKLLSVHGITPINVGQGDVYKIPHGGEITAAGHGPLGDFGVLSGIAFGSLVGDIKGYNVQEEGPFNRTPNTNNIGPEGLEIVVGDSAVPSDEINIRNTASYKEAMDELTGVGEIYNLGIYANKEMRAARVELGITSMKAQLEEIQELNARTHTTHIEMQQEGRLIEQIRAYEAALKDYRADHPETGMPRVE